MIVLFPSTSVSATEPAPLPAITGIIIEVFCKVVAVSLFATGAVLQAVKFIVIFVLSYRIVVFGLSEVEEVPRLTGKPLSTATLATISLFVKIAPAAFVTPATKLLEPIGKVIFETFNTLFVPPPELVIDTTTPEP